MYAPGGFDATIEKWTTQGVYRRVKLETGMRTIRRRGTRAALQARHRAIIVPGRDESHATSAARYPEECLPRAQYWDVLPEEQTAANAPGRLLGFLAAV